MTSPLPRWLSRPYAELLEAKGYLPFTVGEAREVLKDKRTALLLSRLRKTGWVDQVKRETYRVVHPLICILEVSGAGWRSRIAQKDRLPIVELATARAVEEFNESLVSLVLFGSLARGDARPESDIDMLLVVEGLPEEYSKRLELMKRVTEWEPIRRWRSLLWRETKTHPILELIPLTPAEARKTQPFYLDMVEHSVTILDRGELMGETLRRLALRLREIGATKVRLPSGKQYWSLAKGVEEARDMRI